jgi:ligand-binding sensor domain-containing protein
MLLITKRLLCRLRGILSLGIISSFTAVGSKPAKFHLLTIKKYSASDGLFQTAVYDIAQDNNGYIWLATQSCIDKFDGYTFTHCNGKLIKYYRLHYFLEQSKVICSGILSYDI